MTWTIEMNGKELARKTLVEKVLDKRITQKEAASKAGVTERQMRRIIKRYQINGDSGLVSCKRGKPSNRKLKENVWLDVVDFISSKQSEGFGPTFMAEKLFELKGIRVSKETVRQIMIEAGKWKPKAKKVANLHLTRPRRKMRGELVQIDGSKHDWLEDRGPKASLLLFVDDATSEILAGEFEPEESFFAYGSLCKRYFREQGLPKALYSDRFSVFRDNHKGPKVDEPVTQFQRALSVLGIDLICANSPQAKGRVERANQTLQDRLVKEMRLRGINTYEEANAYLPVFIQDYNKRFAITPDSHLDFHRELDLDEDLDFLFSVHSFRIISRALQIQFENKTYQVIPKHHASYYQKQEVLITLNSSGQASAWLDGYELELREIEKHPRQAAVVSTKSEDAKPIAPAYNHPWRAYGKKLNGRPILTTLIVE